MSLGGNLASGNTNTINDSVIQAGIPKVKFPNKCCLTSNSGIVPAVYPSMNLYSKTQICSDISPADFARFPKVAVQSSVRTQAIASMTCPVTPINRFSQYDRYKVPTPCQPVPPTMAGMSLPSSVPCIGSIYPNT